MLRKVVSFLMTSKSIWAHLFILQRTKIIITVEMARTIAETSKTSEHHNPGQTFLIRELAWHTESDGVHLYPSRFCYLNYLSINSECSFVALFCPYNQPYKLCLCSFLSCAVVVPSNAAPGHNIYMVAPNGSVLYCFVLLWCCKGAE